MWRKAITGSSAAAAVWALGTGLAQAHGFSWVPNWPGSFGPAALVTELNSDVADGCPIESADGLSLFIASARTTPAGWADGNNIWVADRARIGDAWGTPQLVGDPISKQGTLDFCPTPVRGRSLMFVSDRPNDFSLCNHGVGGDMYISRQSPAGGWSDPVHLGCAPNGPNTGGGERSPALVETPYGTFLFYSTNGTTGHQDIHVSVMRKDGTFGPGKVVDALSSPGEDIMPNVREREHGGYEMVFSSNRGNEITDQDVYISFAWFLPGPWTKPVKLGGNVNTVGPAEQRATLSHDGKRLYFGRSGEIYMSPRK